MKSRSQTRHAAAVAWLAAALSGCVVSPTHEAPIQERSQSAAAPPAPVTHVGVAPQAAAPATPAPAAATATPPAQEDAGAAEATPVPISPSVQPETRPLETHPLPAPESLAPPAPPAPAPTPIPAERAGEAPAGSAATPPAADRASALEPERPWAWPSAGKLLVRFDETHNKGIDIAGTVGDPVWAANDGKVVYSGSSLHEYGKMIIIEHTKDYVSVYAHNNEILVTEGQTVKRGQRIADLGMSDAPTPRLHFEIRRRGTPVDPMTYLPSR